ncbi:MAG: hypothetical protein ABEI77_06895 [Halorientalis sp.]
MQRRVLCTILLVAIVGLAGCTSGTTDQTGTQTTGHTTDQALQSTTTTVSNFSYPEGTSPSGIKSVETLLDQHDAALAGKSATLVGNKTFSVDTGSQSGQAGFGYIVRHDATNGTTLTTLDFGDGNFTAYVAGGTQYYRIHNESGMTYGTAGADARVRDAGPSSYTGRKLLANILGSGQYEATDVVVRNGTELVRYDLQSLSSTPDDSIDGEVKSADATVFVDSHGIVHEANMTVSTGLFTYDADVHFRNVGETTATKPAWIDQAW